MTDEYLKSIAAIHGAIPPGTTEEVFRNRIKPVLEARAKAAGYAAMVGEVVTAAITTMLIMRRGKRAAENIQTKVNAFVDGRLQDDDVRGILDMYTELPSMHPQAVHSQDTATVIDSNDITTIIPYEEDPGYRRTAADDIKENVKGIYNTVASGIGKVTRGGSALVGIATGAAIIERGPVHAGAKLNAKMETAIGTRAVKIVDRIMKGWDQADKNIDRSTPKSVAVL
ncbi:MAG: hypothetical protein AAB800_00490 [Patescibacteria group bacterium]